MAHRDWLARFVRSGAARTVCRVAAAGLVLAVAHLLFEDASLAAALASGAVFAAGYLIIRAAFRVA